MYDFPSDPMGRPDSAFRHSSGPPPTPDYEDHRHSVLSLVLLIATVAIVGAVALGFTFWALGFLFHALGLIVRIALIAAVVAFVWKRVTRGRWRRI